MRLHRKREIITPLPLRTRTNRVIIVQSSFANELPLLMTTHFVLRRLEFIEEFGPFYGAVVSDAQPPLQSAA